MPDLELSRIVAGVDFSDWTTAVLATASEVAQAFRAGLTVVYAERFEPPPYFTDRGVPELMDALASQKRAARESLDKAVKRDVDGSVNVETRLVETTAASGLLDATEESGAGLVVVGTHGRSGLNRLLLGSVAENVLRRSRVPVLTVRGTHDEAAGCRLPFRRILCPVNYTEVARESLRVAATFAKRFEAELAVITSIEEDTEQAALDRQEAQLCEWVPEEVHAQCTLTPLVRKGQAAEQILTASREGGHDLIVIGAQHKPLLETTIFGTTSIRVMRHATCPVLSVPREHEAGR